MIVTVIVIAFVNVVVLLVVLEVIMATKRMLRAEFQIAGLFRGKLWNVGSCWESYVTHAINK